ncbi:hypothetical protein ACUUMB_23230 [Enterobacter kobei]
MTEGMILFKNLRRKALSVALSAGIPVFCQAALPPDTYTFTVNATILGPQCTWEHSGSTTVDLGNLSVGTAVNNETAVGILKGVCDGVLATRFGFTVSLTLTPKNGLTHELWDTTTNKQIVDGHMEKSKDEVTKLAIRTTGTPLQAGDYNNNVVMEIVYD